MNSWTGLRSGRLCTLQPTPAGGHSMNDWAFRQSLNSHSLGEAWTPGRIRLAASYIYSHCRYIPTMSTSNAHVLQLCSLDGSAACVFLTPPKSCMAADCNASAANAFHVLLPGVCCGETTEPLTMNRSTGVHKVSLSGRIIDPKQTPCVVVVWLNHERRQV